MTLDMTQEKGKISGNISVAFRYANRLDDGEFTARQMSDTQAIGRRESSFGGTTKILFTCVSDNELRIISTFDTQGESYLFNMVMTRQKPNVQNALTPESSTSALPPAQASAASCSQSPSDNDTAAPAGENLAPA